MGSRARHNPHTVCCPTEAGEEGEEEMSEMEEPICCRRCGVVKAAKAFEKRYEPGRVGRRETCMACRSKSKITPTRSPEYLARKSLRHRVLRYAKPQTRLKVLARNTVHAALKDGRLQRQPCEVCGATIVHGHHDDYSKPLEVRWLCPEHHRDHHNAMRAKERAA